MLDKATYTNHLSEQVVFGQNGVFLNSSQLRNYDWNYDSNFEEITNFRKGVVEKTVEIVICARTEEEGIQKRNRIYEIFDRDVLTQSPGYIELDGYYCNGYFISSEKSTWLQSKRLLINKVTFATDSPDWYKYTEYKFEESDSGQTTEGAKRYSYQYDYWYTNLSSSGQITNVGIQDSDFVLRIYGATTNPLVQIGDHTYQVYVSLSETDRLEINSANKTIQLIKKNGQKENVFWQASKVSYIFEPIPTGKVQVSWSGNFSFDLILMDKRSEPRWT